MHSFSPGVMSRRLERVVEMEEAVVPAERSEVPVAEEVRLGVFLE